MINTVIKTVLNKFHIPVHDTTTLAFANTIDVNNHPVQDIGHRLLID